MTVGSIVLGIVLLGLVVVLVMTLLRVDVTLLLLIAIVMAVLLLGVEVTMLVKPVGLSKGIGFVYLIVTLAVAIVLSVFAFKSDANTVRRRAASVDTGGPLESRRATRTRRRAPRAGRRVR